MAKRNKLYKVKLLEKIWELADQFNIEFRIGTTPNDVGIVGVEMPPYLQAAYFGQGVVFVRDKTPYQQIDMNIVLLHEVAHAVLDLYKQEGLKMSDWLEEVSCCHIALAWASQLRLPVSKFMIKNLNKINRGTHETKTNNIPGGRS